jgi:hypothetical protein
MERRVVLTTGSRVTLTPCSVVSTSFQPHSSGASTLMRGALYSA